MGDKIFKILSIDGGGIRGVYPAHILFCMKNRLGNINISQHFDMIAGTSTGSIIAAAVACEKDPADVLSLYREHGPKIFAKRKSCLPVKYQPAIQSLYSNKHLKIILKSIFEDIKLGEITKPLLLPATDVGNGGVHVFKSGYSRDFTRDQDVLLRDAIMASCSAPTYFNPMKLKEYLLADGGLWANNPSLAAVIDAQRRLNIKLADIRILSIGTGLAKTCYGVDTDKKWGLMNGWKGKEFISFMMSLQGQSTHNYLQLMLQDDQLLRLNFETELPLPLDDCTIIDDLISRADKEFTYKSSAIKNLLFD